LARSPAALDAAHMDLQLTVTTKRKIVSKSFYLYYY
jgi:hypothetical protein